MNAKVTGRSGRAVLHVLIGALVALGACAEVESPPAPAAESSDDAGYTGGDGDVSDAERDCVADLTIEQIDGMRPQMSAEEMALECDDAYGG